MEVRYSKLVLSTEEIRVEIVLPVPGFCLLHVNHKHSAHIKVQLFVDHRVCFKGLPEVGHQSLGSRQKGMCAISTKRVFSLRSYVEKVALSSNH